MQYSPGFVFYCKCELQLLFEKVHWDTWSQANFCVCQAWLMVSKWDLVQTQAFHCVSLWLHLPVTLQKKVQWLQTYTRWKTYLHLNQPSFLHSSHILHYLCKPNAFPVHGWKSTPIGINKMSWEDLQKEILLYLINCQYTKISGKKLRLWFQQELYPVAPKSTSCNNHIGAELWIEWDI